VLYIGRMNRFPRRSRGLVAWAAALLIAAGLVVGCGSGRDEPSAVEGSAGGSLDIGDGTGADDARHRAGGQARDTEAAATRADRLSDGDLRRAGNPSRSQRHVRQEQGAAKEGTLGKVASYCLEHFSRATCVEMAKPPKGRSVRFDEPADCLKAMSRKQCEELVAAQRAAQGSGESVDVDECMENPTPRCEEVLRSAYEEQVAASRGEGK
jgi:hypothetical protein